MASWAKITWIHYFTGCANYRQDGGFRSALVPSAAPSAVPSAFRMPPSFFARPAIIFVKASESLPISKSILSNKSRRLYLFFFAQLKGPRFFESSFLISLAKWAIACARLFLKSSSVVALAMQVSRRCSSKAPLPMSLGLNFFLKALRVLQCFPCYPQFSLALLA